MVEITDSFGYWVRRRRKALDLSQADLARSVPCSVAMIKKIEADQRRPSPQLAERLAMCLGLTGGEYKAFLATADGRHRVETLPLDTEPATGLAPIDHLPAPATPLIGREAELTALSLLLAGHDVRLLSIVGPGGMGKTRLALAAAQAQKARHPRPFRDGIVFVELAPVATLDFAVITTAAALGIDLTPRRGETRSATQQVLDYLRPRHLLLVLDNLEHLLADGIAGFALELLRNAPGVKLLTTSRRRLNLRKEQLYSLGGLQFPAHRAHDSNQPIEEFAAVRLLLAVARRQRPGFTFSPADMESMGQICRLVEGMPLALELAAAWVDSLPISAIAAELQGSLDLLAAEFVDLPERHRSIRTVFDATWRRLDLAEQQAFMRLSIFRGGLTRAAAEAVAGATLPMLARLISQCLLQFEPAAERYQLHEVLRQYGEEQINAAGEIDALRHRHFVYYLAFAETATGRLFGPEQIVWLERLEAEHDNFRAALAWGMTQTAMANAAARLAIALAWFWRIRSHVLEGRIWLEQALLLPGLTTATRAELLYHAGHLAWMQDDFALARTREEESLQLWRSLGDAGRRGAGYASHSLGMALYGTELRAPGDLEAAIGAFHASRTLFETVGDAWGVAFAQQWLAFSYIAQGDRSAGLTAAEVSLAGFRQLGNPWGAGMTLGALANLKLQAGDLTEARQLAEEARAMRIQVGHRHSLAVAYELLARIALREGKPNEAIDFYENAFRVFDSIGNRPSAEQMRAAVTSLTAG